MGKGTKFFGLRGFQLNVAVGVIAGMDFLYVFSVYYPTNLKSTTSSDPVVLDLWDILIAQNWL